MSRAPQRIVHEGDALVWLAADPLPDGAAIATSLPSFDEFGHRDPERWRDWFVDAAALVLERTPKASAAVFFQTDVKHEGRWIDKAHLVMRAADRAGVPLLWHKLVLRAPLGTTTRGRPGFAHVLCFSRELRDEPADACPDVLPQLGGMAWPRAIGADVARFVVAWLRDRAQAHTVVDPFCGTGTLLAAANEVGLDAIGVEKHAGRAAAARTLRVPPTAHS